MKSRIELIINGEKVFIPIEITDEQIQQLTKAVEVETPPTGWEMPKVDEICYWINDFGTINHYEVGPHDTSITKEYYDAANCFSSQLIAENIARADKLYKELRRFAVINRANPLDMTDLGGYTITYNYIDNCLECGLTGNWRGFGDVLFDTEAHAQEAINLYRDELLWYFNQMRERF